MPRHAGASHRRSGKKLSGESARTPFFFIAHNAPPKSREFYNAADYVPPYAVFDVAGDNYRVVIVIRCNAKRVYGREVMPQRLLTVRIS